MTSNCDLDLCDTKLIIKLDTFALDNKYICQLILKSIDAYKSYRVIDMKTGRTKRQFNQKGRVLLWLFNILFVLCIILDTKCHNITPSRSYLLRKKSLKLDFAVLTVFPERLVFLMHSRSHNSNQNLITQKESPRINSVQVSINTLSNGL